MQDYFGDQLPELGMLTTRTPSVLLNPWDPHSGCSVLPPSSLMMWWASSLRSSRAFSVLMLRGRQNPDLQVDAT
jgi:hypothetical protein